MPELLCLTSIFFKRVWTHLLVDDSYFSRIYFYKYIIIRSLGPKSKVLENNCINALVEEFITQSLVLPDTLPLLVVS